MFPHIQPQNRGVALHQGAVLVGGAVDINAAILFDDQPGPTAAKAGGGGGGKFFLEGGKAAKLGIDRIRQITGWFAAGIGAHNVPEKGMVVMTAAVVLDGCLLVRRHLIHVAQDLFNALVLQAGAVEGVVQVGDIGVVVLGAMDVHRARINVRFQRVLGVGQLRQCKGHDFLLEWRRQAQAPRNLRWPKGHCRVGSLACRQICLARQKN